MAVLANRVAVSTATTGTGTVTLGSALTDAFLTFAEGGVSDADEVTYLITEGDDFEFGRGTYTASGTTLSRDTVLDSKIGGTAGTTKMTLAGAAEVRIAAAAEDIATTAAALPFVAAGDIAATDVQAAIEELDTEKEPADATILKDADIGDTVQAHSAVLDATTASFLTADETKLDGIEAGADVTDASNVAAAGAHMSGGTDVPIADGGTGSSTAAAAFTALKQAATTTATGVVEKSTSAENIAGTEADKFPDVPGVKEMIDTHAGGGEFTRAAAQATTSGTEFDFTGIPAGVSEIVVSFQGVSLSGTDSFLIQLGDAGGLEATGYESGSFNAASTVTSTSGFIIFEASATDWLSGVMTFYRQEANKWRASHGAFMGGINRAIAGGGTKELSAELTQLRLTRTGTDTFDAGEVNIMYR